MLGLNIEEQIKSKKITGKKNQTAQGFELSIIVPVFNERGNLALLIERLTAALTPTGVPPYRLNAMGL